MISNKDIKDTSAFLNNELIEHMCNYPSLWYKQTVKYTESDEVIWNNIADEMGIQKSFLKQRWQHLRDEYCESGSTLQNPCTKSLSFLKLLTTNIQNSFSSQNDDDEEYEFIVTSEQLKAEDDSQAADTYSADLKERHNSETKIDASAKSRTEITENNNKVKATGFKRKLNERQEQSVSSQNNNRAADTPNVDNRTEDQIFGDFVAATLAKMQTDDKKRAKKEIMNILL